MFIGAKIGKIMIHCKKRASFLKEKIRCLFDACQINLSKFNTSWMSILGFQEEKKGVKMAGKGHAVSKKTFWSKQNGILL